MGTIILASQNYIICGTWWVVSKCLFILRPPPVSPAYITSLPSPQTLDHLYNTRVLLNPPQGTFTLADLRDEWVESLSAQQQPRLWSGLFPPSDIYKCWVNECQNHLCLSWLLLSNRCFQTVKISGGGSRNDRGLGQWGRKLVVLRHITRKGSKSTWDDWEEALGFPG